MMGSAPLEEREERPELPLSVRGGRSKKVDICKPGGGPSPVAESAGTLILDLPTCRTGRTKLLQPRQPLVVRYSSPCWLRRENNLE